jgi:cation transport ATPase
MNMELLVVLGTTAAYGYSVFVVAYAATHGGYDAHQVAPPPPRVGFLFEMIRVFQK